MAVRRNREPEQFVSSMGSIDARSRLGLHGVEVDDCIGHRCEVLRLGGYACEFFVSQTPELTGMADRIIDLEGMAPQVAREAA